MSRNERALPAGTYRILDGRLYRVEPGLPPSLDTRDAEIATLRTRAEQAEAERDEARALLRTATEALAECAPRSLLVDARAERDLESKLKGEALYQAELEADRATKAEAERDEAVENARLTGIRLAGAEAVIRDLRGEGPEHHEYADALVIVAMTLAARDGEGATTMTIRRAAGALRTADKRVAQAEAEVARLRELHSEERTRIEHASTRALAIRQAAGVCRQMQEALENLDARRRWLLSADVQELALSDAEDRILSLLDAALAMEVEP